MTPRFWSSSSCPHKQLMVDNQGLRIGRSDRDPGKATNASYGDFDRWIAFHLFPHRVFSSLLHRFPGICHTRQALVEASPLRLLTRSRCSFRNSASIASPTL